MSHSTNHDLGATKWDEFIGQGELKARLRIEITAILASERENYTPFPHTLLDAPPGTGKTTLAHIIAQELGDPIVTFVAPFNKDSFESHLLSSDPGIIFVDEIHRAPKTQQESLLTMMEQGFYQSPSLGIEIPTASCLIAATTRGEELDDALRDRFTLIPHFTTPYPEVDLVEIIQLMGGKAGVALSDDEAKALARAAAGTPRNARRLILAAQALQLAGQEHTLQAIFHHADVSPDGLSKKQRDYLRALHRFKGRAGVNKLASILRLHPSAMLEIERHLFDIDLITYTGAGRALTTSGFKKVKELAA